ncbi:hypothetical protein AQUCO_02500185v1 [Aquilegia coerulea]|uniref:Uncharacterized protein n=1 Tax=Aquilegia coerulea TaxID=218851 RepID=A0A2G5D9Y5_AQUCA|nr:hypothetical protein AQUCO_02500185v1 [Aquilegia coerulea]
MEEEKAAAYYEELTRKGEGAARFKQGLGFSSSTSTQSFEAISKGSALPSSSSFLSSFVKASSPNKSSNEIDKQKVQLENIQNKLKKKEKRSSDEREKYSRVSDRRDDRDRSLRRRSRSRDRDRDRGRSERRRRRSRSRSYSRERHGRRRRSRSRSKSPRDRRRLEKSRDDDGRNKKEKNGGGVDYSRLIKGYAEMSPAERVKAKMKLQLSQTAEKDADKGMGAGWERFQFNKDAPLDDEEIEVAEDDAAVVKKMGQSFRFSALQEKREEQIKDAHDQAMFGVPVAQPCISTDTEVTIEGDKTDDDDDRKGTSENGLGANLISDKVLAKQQGSWRDRARKPKDG